MKDFEHFFQTELVNQVKDIELTRKNLKALRVTWLKIIIPLLAVLGLFAGYKIYQITGELIPAFGALFSVVIMGFFLAEYIIGRILNKKGFDKAEKDFKNGVMSKIVSFIGNDLHYNPTGTLTNEELLKSGLLDIKKNTSVFVDDLISGTWDGAKLTIANVKTTAYVATREGRPRKPKPDESIQGFNGIYAHIEYKNDLRAYLIPKKFTGKGITSFRDFKIARDESMTMEEQRAFNLAKMAEGETGGYKWNMDMVNQANLKEYDMSKEGLKPYLLFTNSEKTHQTVAQSSTISKLLSASFVDSSTIEKISTNNGLTTLSDATLSDLIKTNMIFAIHSDSAWVLIPAIGDKFELLLNQELNLEHLKGIYDDILLALFAATSISKIE